jgi:hypothetical protein
MSDELRGMFKSMSRAELVGVAVDLAEQNYRLRERLDRALERRRNGSERVERRPNLFGFGGGRGAVGTSDGEKSKRGKERKPKRFYVDFTNACGSLRQIDVEADTTQEARIVVQRQMKREGENMVGAKFKVTRAS